MTRIAASERCPHIASRTFKDIADNLIKAAAHGFATTVQGLVTHIRGVGDHQIVLAAREQLVRPCRERIAANYANPHSFVAIREHLESPFAKVRRFRVDFDRIEFEFATTMFPYGLAYGVQKITASSHGIKDALRAVIDRQMRKEPADLRAGKELSQRFSPVGWQCLFERSNFVSDPR